MPKYLLLKHYRGGPEPHRPVPPMDQWAAQDVEAHIAFLRHVSELLEENGEYVDAQALTPARTWVRYGGPDAAPVTTDGPHPETSDLIAGWYMIDVESHERALRARAEGRFAKEIVPLGDADHDEGAVPVGLVAPRVQREAERNRHPVAKAAG